MSLWFLARGCWLFGEWDNSGEPAELLNRNSNEKRNYKMELYKLNENNLNGSFI